MLIIMAIVLGNLAGATTIYRAVLKHRRAYGIKRIIDSKSWSKKMSALEAGKLWADGYIVKSRMYSSLDEWMTLRGKAHLQAFVATLLWPVLLPVLTIVWAVTWATGSIMDKLEYGLYTAAEKRELEEANAHRS